MINHANDRRRRSPARAAAGAAALLALGACAEGDAPLGFLRSGDEGTAEAASDAGTTETRLVERDVEAPEVFEVTEMGLWDGRPSLGGVWVAHPDVDEPERVIIRNTANSKFVIGALFRRERDTPGPAVQVSSDAAEALGMLAGDPAMLNVTALRKEKQPAADATEGAAPEGEETGAPASDAVEETALDPVAGAAAAIDEAEAEAAESDTDATDAPATRPAAQDSALDKPYIQIGLFSVEENARNTATAMRQNGMVPLVRKETSRGKTFWRVVVGPAADRSERGALLRKIEGVGFEDAYPVTN